MLTFPICVLAPIRNVQISEAEISFFGSNYKLEVLGESVVYTHLMKHRRNEHVSFLSYHSVSFRDQFLTCRMAVIPSYCRLSNLRSSPGLLDWQHEGSTIPLGVGNCSRRRRSLHDTVYCRECRSAETWL